MRIGLGGDSRPVGVGGKIVGSLFFAIFLAFGIGILRGDRRRFRPRRPGLRLGGDPMRHRGQRGRGASRGRRGRRGLRRPRPLPLPRRRRAVPRRPAPPRLLGLGRRRRRRAARRPLPGRRRGPLLRRPRPTRRGHPGAAQPVERAGDSLPAGLRRRRRRRHRRPLVAAGGRRGGREARTGRRARRRSRAAASRARGWRPWGLAGFFGLFLLAGLGVFIPFFALPAWRTIQARSWPETPCTVLHSAVRSHPGDDSTTYSVEVLYSYRIGGHEFKSSRYTFFGGSSSGVAAKEEAVARYPDGSRAVCYVNPADPTDAVLVHGLPGDAWFGLIPLVFVAVGAGGIAFSLAGYRRQAAATRAVAAGAAAVTAAPTPRGRRRRPCEPKSGPVGKLVGITFAALFWNGIVGVFAWEADRDLPPGGGRRLPDPLPDPLRADRPGAAGQRPLPVPRPVQPAAAAEPLRRRPAPGRDDPFGVGLPRRRRAHPPAADHRRGARGGDGHQRQVDLDRQGGLRHPPAHRHHRRPTRSPPAPSP